MRFLILQCLTIALCANDVDPNVTIQPVANTQNIYVITDKVSGQRWLLSNGVILLNLITLPKVEVPVAPMQPSVLELDTSKMKTETSETFINTSNPSLQIERLALSGWKVTGQVTQAELAELPKYTLQRVVPK